MIDHWWEDTWYWGSTLATFKRASAMQAELSQAELHVQSTGKVLVLQDNLGASGRAEVCFVTVLVTRQGKGKDAGRMPGSLTSLIYDAHIF